MRVAAGLAAVLLCSASASAQPIPEERPRRVWLRLTEGRALDGTLVGRDDEHHWIETADGVVRVRMADVASMSDTPPAEGPEERPLPRRKDLGTVMVVVGGVVFGLAYLGAIGGIEEAGDDGGLLAIPVLGPFAYSMSNEQCCEQAGLLTFASFLQGAALWMFLAGAFGSPPAPFVVQPDEVE